MRQAKHFEAWCTIHPTHSQSIPRSSAVSQSLQTTAATRSCQCCSTCSRNWPTCKKACRMNFWSPCCPFSISLAHSFNITSLSPWVVMVLIIFPMIACLSCSLSLTPLSILCSVLLQRDSNQARWKLHEHYSLCRTLKIPWSLTQTRTSRRLCRRRFHVALEPPLFCGS